MISPLSTSSYFQRFSTPIAGISLPEKLAYPFYYVPHEIAMIAAKELQQYLQEQKEWVHNFGFDATDEGIIIGKMFGVLVVKNMQNELGYLCAVSGKLAGQNLHDKFVPPVFDILEEEGFFRKGETIITAINSRIAALEESTQYKALQQKHNNAKLQAQQEINAQKKHNNEQKKQRDQQRITQKELLSESEYQLLLKDLEKQSVFHHYQYKSLKKEWDTRLEQIEKELHQFQGEIDTLKEERKQKSARLQNEIFDHFYFVNKKLERKSVGEIFKHTPEGRPRAGSGECAAPKLFQYAFLHQLEPIALAEFWWGQSPKTEVRLHGQFYPACRGKCEPILGHMLQGIPIEANPMLENPAEGKELSIVWEDEYLVIVNKPEEFLSVPGINISDSVLTRLKLKYPEASGPMVVHRLDMSTSGILIAAKDITTYKTMQRQFMQRKVEKRYCALLNGDIAGDEGMIQLPIRVDLDDRPRQMVCYEHGKPAQTRWKVLEKSAGKTRIAFYPITGRTHQLRVHAAHPDGLGTPIVGDDLYGNRADRLHLHAESITFYHPKSNERMTFEIPAPF